MATTPMWGPFRGGPDALDRLGGFVDAHLGPDVGIAWTAQGALVPLRRPSFHFDGAGTVLVVEWVPFPTFKQVAGPSGTGLVDWIRRVMSQVGEGQMATAQAQQAMSLAVASAAERFLAQYGTGAAGVGIDLVVVALTIGAPLSGSFALAALLASIFLLGSDGFIFGSDLLGYEQTSKSARRYTEIPRILATAACLPDAAWGGFKAVAELVKVQEASALTAQLAIKADAVAAAAANSVRAQRYATVARLARQLAEKEATKLQQLWLHEVTPRALLPMSIKLLLDDEIDPSNTDPAASYLQHYIFHVVAAVQP